VVQPVWPRRFGRPDQARITRNNPKAAHRIYSDGLAHADKLHQIQSPLAGFDLAHPGVRLLQSRTHIAHGQVSRQAL
jgi:hypothetical protein